VDAVFRPGLCKGFKLSIRGLTAEIGEVSLDGFHLFEIQREASIPADSHELTLICVGERDSHKLEFVALSVRQHRDERVAVKDVLNDVVSQDALGQALQFLVFEFSLKLILACDTNLFRAQSKVMNALQDTCGGRFHDPRFLQNLSDTLAHSLDEYWASDGVFFGERIGQELFCDGFRLTLMVEALNYENGCRAHRFDGVDAELSGLFEDIPAVWVTNGLPPGNFYMK